MNQIYVNGHSIMVKGDNLIIDGKLVDVKLKRSLFGGTSIVSSGGTIVNSFVSGAIVSKPPTELVKATKIMERPPSKTPSSCVMRTGTFLTCGSNSAPLTR